MRGDVGGAWLLPGFVDMHVHGGGGATYTSGDADEARAAAAFHRSHGTTTTMASLVTAGLDDLERTVRALAPLVDEGVVYGLHLEGPYLSPSHAGAHDPALLRTPDTSELDRMLDAAGGTVRMVTVAPELPGGMDLVRQTVDAGAVAAIGHTDATTTRPVRRSTSAHGWRRTSTTRCVRSTIATRDRSPPRSRTTA